MITKVQISVSVHERQDQPCPATYTASAAWFQRRHPSHSARGPLQTKRAGGPGHSRLRSSALKRGQKLDLLVVPERIRSRAPGAEPLARMLAGSQPRGRSRGQATSMGLQGSQSPPGTHSEDLVSTALCPAVTESARPAWGPRCLSGAWGEGTNVRPGPERCLQMQRALIPCPRGIRPPSTLSCDHTADAVWPSRGRHAAPRPADEGEEELAC